MNKSCTVKAISFIAISVILGAFAAHALKDKLNSEQLATFEVGVRYLMYSGLGLLILGTWKENLSKLLKWPVNLIFTGTILFSGSILLLSAQQLLGTTLKFLGPVTPLGGTLMIIGWSILLVKIISNRD